MTKLNENGYVEVVNSIIAVVYDSELTAEQQVEAVKEALAVFAGGKNDESARQIRGANAMEALANKIAQNGKHELAKTVRGMTQIKGDV